MEAVVRFTPKPQWVTTTGPSASWDVMRFINFEGLQLSLKLIGFEGASDPVLQIAMETGMHFDRDFAPLGRFQPVITPGEVVTRRFGAMLPFVRWNVVQLVGATAACFTIEGKALP